MSYPFLDTSSKLRVLVLRSYLVFYCGCCSGQLFSAYCVFHCNCKADKIRKLFPRWSVFLTLEQSRSPSIIKWHAGHCGFKLALNLTSFVGNETLTWVLKCLLCQEGAWMWSVKMSGAVLFVLVGMPRRVTTAMGFVQRWTSLAQSFVPKLVHFILQPLYRNVNAWVCTSFPLWLMVMGLD